MKIALFIILIFFLTSCENLLINEELKSNQMTNYELYWNDFDQHYPAFIQRGINWDSIRQASISKINNGLTEGEFLEMMEEITLNFKDIHLQIETPQKSIFYKNYNPNSANSVTTLLNYVNFPQWINSAIIYTTIQNENIGYINISNFSSSLEVSDFESIDEVLSNLSSSSGIILDVRLNGGGASSNQKTIASRFIKETVRIQHQLRNGAGHDDFDTPVIEEVSPQGGFQYTKPVVLLTNAKTASAAETFALTLMNQEHVTIVGDTTAKSFGNSIWRELPNGWNYRMTTTLVSNQDGITFEGKGITPDEVVWISKTDSINNIDRQLEKAIELLQ